MERKKCQTAHRAVCRGTWDGLQGGLEEQAILAGCMEKLGEGACGLDVGGCGAKGPFEGVFHEDPLDKPDWKGECLQLQTWEAAM